jgi:hypothetical protein
VIAMPPRVLFTSSHALGHRFSRDWILHRAHAAVGAYVLGHFMYRYATFFLDTTSHADMGFDSSTPFFWLFLPHLCLQVSGLGFAIPPKRHPDGNRIWAEYRWHALAFCARCLALMFCAWQKKKGAFAAEPTIFLSVPLEKWLVTSIFLINMMIVDKVTTIYSNRGESSNTIRGLRCSSALKYLLSVSQFHANVSCLLNNDSMSVPFAALVVVQSSAFGMTLRRKGFIGLELGLVLYSLVLLLGILVIRDDLMRRGLLLQGTTIANFAAVARMDLGFNKYTLWLVVSFVLMAATTSPIESTLNQTWMYLLFSLSLVIVLASAVSRGEFDMNSNAMRYSMKRA